MHISRHNMLIGAGVLLLVIGSVFFVSKRTGDLGHEERTGGRTDTPSANVDAPVQGTDAPLAAPALPLPPTQVGKLYKDFVRPTGFANTTQLQLLNTDAFTLKQFIGKRIILLNFWTTSASNALRTLPYLNTWHTMYKDDGLLVVSVHVPRFSFEQSKNVIDKVTSFNHVMHPIVLDNNYETWNAYSNTVWPHQYLIDIDGRIAYDHAGEGAYQATDAKIRELLSLRAQKLGLPSKVYPSFKTPAEAIAIDLARLKSPETYFGSARNNSLGNGTPLKEGTQDLEYPDMSLAINNTPYLAKSWSFTKEYAQNLVADASIHYHYYAKIVDAVLGAQKPTRVKVLRDDRPLTPMNAGKDIHFENGESYFYVSGARIYEIVNDQTGYGQHALDLIFESPGLEVYTITFG